MLYFYNYLNSLDDLKEPKKCAYCPTNFVDRESPDITWIRGLSKEDDSSNDGLIDEQLFTANMVEPIGAEHMRNILSMYFMKDRGMVP